jgi:hypothetical protein
LDERGVEHRPYENDEHQEECANEIQYSPDLVQRIPGVLVLWLREYMWQRHFWKIILVLVMQIV